MHQEDRLRVWRDKKTEALKLFTRFFKYFSKLCVTKFAKKRNKYFVEEMLLVAGHFNLCICIQVKQEKKPFFSV